MSVRVRLTRVGSRKNPIWRVVVADQRSPRDGRLIESIGHYNPQTEPSTIVIDRDRLDHWLQRGAQPTNTVRKLMRAENTALKPAHPPEPEVVAPAVEPDTDTPPETAEPPRGAESDADASPDAAAPTPAEPDAAGPSEATDEPVGGSDTPAG